MKFPSVEIDKRDRDEHTDSLIKSLLDEEKVSKKQKRGPPQPVVDAKPVAQPRKGKTLAEIEAEEGGPIKESLVGMAHTKRALDRKKRDVDFEDTDVVTNTERFEKETLDIEQEGGIAFEPFNLKQEREEGCFDDDGNYVLRKQPGAEGDDEKDAWLDSEEAMVVSDVVRKKIEEQRARAEEAARRGPLTERQIAQHKASMVAVMRPGETVTRALKRLGGGAATAGAGGAGPAGSLPHRAIGKRERARLLAQRQQHSTDAGTAPSSSPTSGTETWEQFSRLTELADELLEEGELEIYSTTLEELIRSACIWLPQLAAPVHMEPPEPAATGVAAGSTAARDLDDDMFGDDDDDVNEKAGGTGGMVVKRLVSQPPTAGDLHQDMFGDDDDHDDNNITEGGCVGGAREGAAVSVDHEGEEAAAGSTSSRSVLCVTAGEAAALTGLQSNSGVTDYDSWPIKELKRLLMERGVDSSIFVEKGELVAKVREVVDVAGPETVGLSGSTTVDASAFIAPPGYVYDSSSGYFYSEEAGMYYDTTTGGYCQAASGKWYYLDSSNGAFIEWKH